MELPRRVGGVAGHDEEVCGGGGQREGERERGQRWNTRGKRRRKWSGPRRWRRRQWRKMEKSAGNVGGGEAAAGAGGGGAG